MHGKSQPASGPKINSQEQQRIREKQRGIWRYLPSTAEWVQGQSSEPNLSQSSDSEFNVRPYKHLRGGLWKDFATLGMAKLLMRYRTTTPELRTGFSKSQINLSSPSPAPDKLGSHKHTFYCCLFGVFFNFLILFLKVFLKPLEHNKQSWYYSRN